MKKSSQEIVKAWEKKQELNLSIDNLIAKIKKTNGISFTPIAGAATGVIAQPQIFIRR